MNGHFIVFEGLDGVGKSTQIRLLQQWLREQGYDVLTTREPGGVPISEQIREIILSIGNTDMDPVAECYLYAAARAQHVRQLILPALSKGKVVLCDRYLASSIAYQGYARGLGKDMVMNINREAISGVLPNLTIFLDMPFDEGRIRGKKDRLENSGGAFYDRVYQGYLEQYDTGHVVDATQSIELIAQQIQDYTRELLHE